MSKETVEGILDKLGEDATGFEIMKAIVHSVLEELRNDKASGALPEEKQHFLDAAELTIPVVFANTDNLASTLAMISVLFSVQPLLLVTMARSAGIGVDTVDHYEASKGKATKNFEDLFKNAPKV